MKVGIVTYWFERGAALVSRAYLETLSEQHTVFVYVRGGERTGQGDPKWDRPYVTWGKRVGEDRLATAIDWADFEAWVARCQLDTVIFNEQHSWEVITRCLDLNVTLGAYVDYYTADTVPFFDLYDYLLCNTRRHYGVFRHHPQAMYIPWGVDCDVFHPMPRPASTDVRFFHSAGMGGVELRKGTDLLVRAFQKVTGPARLIIHSQVPINYYGEIAALIQSDPRIEFIESTVGAPGLYHLGDVYAYPSKLEGIGLTITEALASGLPVITTDCAPMNEFVIENVTGKLVEVSHYQPRVDGYYWPQSICSEAALAAALQFYVDNPLEMTRQQNAARAQAERQWNWRINSAELPDQIANVRRLDKQPGLVDAVNYYERQRQAHLHMDLAFAAYDQDRYDQTRLNLWRGLRLDPGWLQQRSVWSIGLKATLGRPIKRVLKPALRSNP